MWPERTHVTSVSETEEPMHSGGKRRRLGRDHQKYWGKPWRRHKIQWVWRRRDSSKRGRKLERKFRWDEEMYSWDELEYKVNYVHFISNESTEQQVQIASAVVDKLEEPVYDHRTRIKERSRPLQKHNDNQPISVFCEIGGIKAHCLIDSGCKGIMISPNFIRAAKIEPFPLDKRIGIQLAVTGSKSVINYGKCDHKIWWIRIERIFWYHQHRLLWCNLRNSIPKKTWSDDWLPK